MSYNPTAIFLFLFLFFFRFKYPLPSIFFPSLVSISNQEAPTQSKKCPPSLGKCQSKKVPTQSMKKCAAMATSEPNSKHSPTKVQIFQTKAQKLAVQEDISRWRRSHLVDGKYNFRTKRCVHYEKGFCKCYGKCHYKHGGHEIKKAEKTDIWRQKKIMRRTARKQKLDLLDAPVEQDSSPQDSQDHP